MDKTIGWTAFYDNGQTYTDSDYLPEDLPADGLQWIVEKLDSGGRRYVHGMDYYRWTGDSWAGGNVADLEKWIRLLFPIIKFGRWISDTDYEKIEQLAIKCYGS